MMSMSMDLLDAPLRISWDLHDGLLPADPVLARTIAADLVGAGVFFVTLEERPLRHPAGKELVQTLAEGGCRCRLVCDGTPEELEALPEGLPLEVLYLNVEQLREDRAQAASDLDGAVSAVRERGFEPALLLPPLRENLDRLPGLLEFCRTRRIGRFKLPNLKIGGSFGPARHRRVPGPQDLEHLRQRLATQESPPPGDTQLEIHDLFLWELLSPDRDEARSEYGGCQAANGLGHIDAAGGLFPCASWPERMGALGERSVADVWRSPRRHRVREEIAATPPGCVSCRDYPTCFGGCRGLSRTLNRAGGFRDLMCPGPR